MLSYQHGYHAGNKADVLKHAVLHGVLQANPSKASKLYIETHSGRARYDLAGEEAKKTGEAADGVVALLKGKPPAPLKPWTEYVSSQGLKAYPGSPALAAHLLGPHDRMVFFELHPAEHQALEAALKSDDRALVKKADGYSGALRLAPRSREDMIVFCDPSYETLRDMDALAEWTPRALKRWPKARIILWLPLFRDEREVEFGEFLSSLEDGVVAGARWKSDPLDETALAGSAIVAYRATQAESDAALSIASALQNYWANT